MPKTLSDDLRRRVLEYSKEGLIQKKIAKILKVSTSFVSRLLKRYENEKTIKPKKPITTRPFKIDCKEVKRYADKNPDATLEQIGKNFGSSHFAIFFILKI
jgi:transposase